MIIFTNSTTINIILSHPTMTYWRTTDIVTETLAPSTSLAGNLSHVVPGKSNDQDIKGDFPLDQIVIDRK